MAKDGLPSLFTQLLIRKVMEKIKQFVFIKIFIITLILSLSHAYAEDWRNPDAPFDASKNSGVKKEISWHAVPDIQKTCELEHIKRGFKNQIGALMHVAFGQVINVIFIQN